MNGILKNKTAIVTGGAKGIGRAIAERFSAVGAKVVVADIDGDGATKVAASLEGALAVTCDVTDEQHVASLVAAAVSEYGQLDVMVNNAGVVGVSPVVDTSFEEWRRVLAVNLDGVFLGVKHAAPAIVAAEGGSIVNIASIKAFGGLPTVSSYASKAAVVSLTKSAALELRGNGVRVNAICPGYLATEPDEITGLALFLASDRSRLMNGAACVVDGGALASLI